MAGKAIPMYTSRTRAAAPPVRMSSTWAGKVAARAAVIPRAEAFMDSTMRDGAVIGCWHRTDAEY
jgi:hypothetical protein